MIEPEEIVERIQASLTGAEVYAMDLTGTRDHYKAIIISELFDGKSRLARHRMVYAALVEEMKGPIHALSLETYTPAQWEQRDK